MAHLKVTRFKERLSRHNEQYAMRSVAELIKATKNSDDFLHS